MKHVLVSLLMTIALSEVFGSIELVSDQDTVAVVMGNQIAVKQDKNPLNNPGYLGLRKAFSIIAVTNGAGLFREKAKYQTNYAFVFEVARKSSLAYQFGYKSISRTLDNYDWNDYDTYVERPTIGGGNLKYFKPFGEMDINYQEFTVGVKNYLLDLGSTAPYGGYLVANLHYGLAKAVSNNLSWSNVNSSSGVDTLSRVGVAGVSGSLVSMSYGFGSRNMLTDQLGLVFEMTSGLTLLNSAGFSVNTLDEYSSGAYHGVDQADVMRRVMIREFHKSQWIQLKVGLSYLF